MPEYILNLYEKAMPDDMPLEEKFAAAKELGFDSVEICVDLLLQRQERLSWDKNRIDRLKSWMTERGFGVYTVSLSALRGCPLGSLNAGENVRALDMLERGLLLTKTLGARVMLINGYDVYDAPSTPETARRFGENLKKAAALAEKHGVVTGLENAEMPFIDTLEKAVHWAKRIESPYLCVYGDTGNSYNALNADTELVLNDFESGRGKIIAAHLKDSLPGEYRHVDYGNGHVDFKAATRKLVELGVRIYTAELFYRPGHDWLQEARRVNRFLRGYLDNA